MPPIDSHVRACHVRARRTEEEHSGATEIFGLAELAEHVLGWPVDSSLGVETKELFHHGGDDVAWRYRVYTDAVLAPLGG